MAGYIYNMATRLKKYGGILKEAFTLFIKNDPLKLGGATSFFTLFALPPVLTILIQLLSLFIDPQSIRQEMFISLSELFGKETVRQLVSVIRALRQLNGNLFSTILVFVFLLFVATTVFKIIRSSINQIWAVAPAKGKRVMTGLKDRLLSVGVIIVTALLFSVGMLTEALQLFAGNFFIKLFPSVSGLLSQGLAFVVSVFIISLWFTIVFKYLNDRHPGWRVAWAGGLFTSVLFSIGKFILHVLLTYNNINNIYGASAAIVLLLLFVFYSAMILYFGAAFTKVWGEYREKEYK
jgi:membrane protein